MYKGRNGIVMEVSSLGHSRITIGLKEKSMYCKEITLIHSSKSSMTVMERRIRIK